MVDDCTGSGLGVPQTAVLGTLAHALMLTSLARTGRLGARGALVASVAGAVLNAAVAAGLTRTRSGRAGPADLVTLTRATLACAVAGLVADEPGPGARPAPLVPLAVVALLLDGVDGSVARRTGSVSAFGARFDGEVDAFLILALSVHGARSRGWWVLGPGLARYAFGVAGWLRPWMARQLPTRHWRKVATAVEGIALTVAAAEVLPRRPTTVLLAVGAGLIAESFGRDVLWLWHHRSPAR